MNRAPIFDTWTNDTSTHWGQKPMRLSHSLHAHELFQMPALEKLVESYPREHYQLVQWGETDGRAGGREGEIGKLDGKAVIAAVEKSRVWINLRNVPLVDPRYAALLDQIYAELESYMPGFQTTSRTMGILISSPQSRTHYHCDLPGQSLWQIHGRKNVYLYPVEPPFVSHLDLERLTLSKLEGLAYDPAFDDKAQVLELEPGQMLHWPLNAPHRVDNHDCLNVSMTLEYFTPDIRRIHMINRANAILRSGFGLNPKSRATDGPAFWAKAVLQRALRDTSFVRRAVPLRKPVEFRLDPARPDAIAEIGKA